jgi:hypothetical protein
MADDFLQAVIIALGTLVALIVVALAIAIFFEREH